MDGKFLILIFVGMFLVDSTDGISGGENVDPDWKGYVAIYNSRHDYICTGTILSMTAAVTSASCLGYYADFNESSGIDRNHMLALFGRALHTDRRNRDDNHHIKELKKHPNWDPEEPDHDCAIIKPFKSFNDDEGRVMSIPRKDTELIFPGQKVHILGWGASRENFPNEYIMQKGDSVIIPIEECKEKYPDENLNEKWFLCTHQLRTGACSGDDGGPVAVRSPSKFLVLVGIIGYRRGCGYPEYPDVHTHIFSVLDFITENVGDATIDPK